jgi:hypothetical protein
VTRTLTVQPDPALTNDLRESLACVVNVFESKPELITQALTDRYTRREMRQLVNDLFSLVAVIEAEVDL